MIFTWKRSLSAVFVFVLATPPATSFAGASQHTADATPIPPDRGAAETWQLLKKLHTRASVLMIVAHPDDEDGALLTYQSRGLGARTSLLTLDRGEGGANVMSPDLWDALGLVRTEELLQAGRFYGLDAQYFTTMADYGFSKSLAEALSQWGHERVLEQAVRIVRVTRPLVVCSVFVGGPTDGHGQHATAGLMAQEVFNAAGNPKMFPEQIKEGLLPWSPLKTYARAPFFRTSEKGSYDYANHTWGPVGVTNYITGKWEPGPVSTTVSVPTGTYDPVLGETYPQISREGLGYQRSQNGGPDVPLPNAQVSAYHRFATRVVSSDHEQSFYDGIDTTLTGIATLAGPAPNPSLRRGLADINTLVEKAISEFSAQNPSAIAPILAQGLEHLETLIAQQQQSALSPEQKYNVLHELEAKQSQFNRALISALELSLNADVSPAGGPDPFAEFRGTQPTFQMATPGRQFNVKLHLYEGAQNHVDLTSLAIVPTSKRDWSIKSAAPISPLTPQKPEDLTYTVTVPADEPFTRPYFTRAGLESPFYEVAPGSPVNAPQSPYPLRARADLTFMGVELNLSAVVQVVSKVNGPGTLRYPLPVGPALSVAISPAAGIIPIDAPESRVRVRIHNNAEGAANATVHLAIPEGWTADPATLPVAFSQSGEEQTVSFTLHPRAVENKTYTVTAVADFAGHQYKEGYVTTGYTGLRPYFLYSPARYTTTATNVKMAPNESVAYIEGSGDDVPAALEALGVYVSYLSAQDLATADLQHYSVILLGVRAYAVRPDLVANNSRLLKYVENGGVVIVQYNTPEYDHNYGPYPYVMTGDPEEVTDEHSVVRILAPTNPVFTWPNKISDRDFAGWIEERGSKFLSTWSPNYEALLETHDNGQPEQKGGLLYARYGKGVYVYNAYAFYRQLPAGVPGAYRLFANLLSLPSNPGLK